VAAAKAAKKKADIKAKEAAAAAKAAAPTEFVCAVCVRSFKSIDKETGTLRKHVNFEGAGKGKAQCCGAGRAPLNLVGVDLEARGADPLSLIGWAVEMPFEGKPFPGTVMSYKRTLGYFIQYEDGDSGDHGLNEIDAHITKVKPPEPMEPS
jgi:hypothetical protein